MDGLAVRDFWQGRRVLVTGHSGFKGAWLTLWLERLGASVACLALEPPTDPALWSFVRAGRRVDELVADIRDPAAMAWATATEPEIVFHLAAQSLVRRGYREPSETFDVNVLGTVRLLDALRECPSVKAVVVVTSDKVYDPDAGERPYREGSPLGGHDPYSASKAACEMVVASYRRSFYEPRGIGLATARAGNVIGGGDWSDDRLLPDLVKALDHGTQVALRYPGATRPWQHVLDPLHGYLLLAQSLLNDPVAALPAVNFGPLSESTVPVREVAERFCAYLGGPGWRVGDRDNPPEAPALELCSELATKALDWAPLLDLDTALAWTAEWYLGLRAGQPALELSTDQIERFENRAW